MATIRLMNAKILTVYAPASSGNVSVGFDALGLALAPVDGSLMGDCVSIVEGNPDDWMLCIDGPFAHALPQNQEQNIVITSCRRFEQAARVRFVELAGSSKLENASLSNRVRFRVEIVLVRR